MSVLRLGQPQCVKRTRGAQGMNMGAYYAEAVSCHPTRPPGLPAYTISFDWDACLIDGVHFKQPDVVIADGVTYTSPNWPAGNYCYGGSGLPQPNPGNAVDGVVVCQYQMDGTYKCVAATGWYLFAGWVGRTQPLAPPGVGCVANDRPIPDGSYCDCCAGALTDLVGVLYCTTFSIP